jgi:8-hydroxy-5-deazaflavin:NADPH oxidoreductase
MKPTTSSPIMIRNDRAYNDGPGQPGLGLLVGNEARLPNWRLGHPGSIRAHLVTRLSSPRLLCLPSHGGLIDDALGQTGPLAGKVVIDTTNQFGVDGLVELPSGTSAFEVNARRMPGALLVKAFNRLTARYQRDVAEGRVDGEVAMFFAAQDGEAIEAAGTLIAACGFVPVFLGGWERVRLMEAPRRPGAVFGEAYRPQDARRIAAAPLEEAARLADELKIGN